MSDYYSYAPLVRLQKPLLLCGLPGADVAMTARVATMLTGLQLVSVDRRVEHLASNAAELVEFREGREQRLALEEQVIAEALGRRSPPVIAASPVTLTSASLVDRLAGAHWLCLHMTVAEAMEAMRRQVAEDRRRHYALRAGGPVDDSLRPELEQVERVLRGTPDRIPIRGRTALEVGEEVAAWLMDGTRDA